MFAQALSDGTMGCFFRLIEQFRTQDEPAFCGLGTLTMVLNALNVDPMRTWKGPWRWFNESNWLYDHSCGADDPRTISGADSVVNVNAQRTLNHGTRRHS